MKIYIGVFVMIFAIYLAFSFYNISFNIVDWDEFSRAMVAFLSIGCLFMGLIIHSTHDS